MRTPSRGVRARAGVVAYTVAVAAVLLSLGGCAGVAPWEKEALAGEGMVFRDNALAADTDDHIYFSKEATSGGRSFAGGGCGCN